MSHFKNKVDESAAHIYDPLTRIRYTCAACFDEVSIVCSSIRKTDTHARNSGVSKFVLWLQEGGREGGREGRREGGREGEGGGGGRKGGRERERGGREGESERGEKEERGEIGAVRNVTRSHSSRLNSRRVNGCRKYSARLFVILVCFRWFHQCIDSYKLMKLKLRTGCWWSLSNLGRCTSPPQVQ